MEPDPVDWAVAERVAVRVANRSAPQIDARTLARLEADFAEATPRAEALVTAATGLVSSEGPATGTVTDRAGWVRANLSSFQRLIGPLVARAAAEGTLGRMLPGPLGRATRATAGAELGAVLGWMSTRVLGQYDLLLAEGSDGPGDVVYYVGPNILLLERRHGFAPREFRLWIAIHELTHRAQFTGVPWMRAHFLSLVDRGVRFAPPDPRSLVDMLGRMAVQVVNGKNPLGEAGIAGLFASGDQLAALQEVQGLMSLLEGHGDVTMNRAAAEALPEAGRFAETLQARRDQVGGVSRLVQQLLGLEAKMRQYKEGEEFVEAVEAAGGPELFARVWSSPACLPSLAEVREPARWVERMAALHLEPA